MDYLKSKLAIMIITEVELQDDDFIAIVTEDSESDDEPYDFELHHITQSLKIFHNPHPKTISKPEIITETISQQMSALKLANKNMNDEGCQDSRHRSMEYKSVLVEAIACLMTSMKMNSWVEVGSFALDGENSESVNPLITQNRNRHVGHNKMALSLHPTKVLSRFVYEHKYKEGFTAALQSSDVWIVSWLCSQKHTKNVVKYYVETKEKLKMHKLAQLSSMLQITSNTNLESHFEYKKSSQDERRWPSRGFDHVLEKKPWARVRRSMSCYGRFMPHMFISNKYYESLKMEAKTDRNLQTSTQRSATQLTQTNQTKL
ncbi:WD40 repeat-containing protein [Artemisia annua]|uniref:WD40 repeat-containing protein n=1 Tax=Artemisia annua TaxID=35608 RepID=A0A2U1PBG9_ARTAN|nr:WD40 repeat-containing protein [Artemisia annua]